MINSNSDFTEHVSSSDNSDTDSDSEIYSSVLIYDSGNPDLAVRNSNITIN